MTRLSLNFDFPIAAPGSGLGVPSVISRAVSPVSLAPSTSSAIAFAKA